ncbi:plasmid maintenance protein CcdA [Pragia fontium]|uniref:type II toxin-antitoxin system CcdA family antitoxin n=1 Tax=Pragia fontium TaxID=82985 RepID=UPI000E03FEF5|nr:plasmid maintenance protein CcdA [Pragia fontium]
MAALHLRLNQPCYMSLARVIHKGENMSVTHAKTTKKTVSVTLDPDLYQRARDMGINFSALLTQAVEQQLQAASRAQWQRDNQQAMEELNRITERCGLLSDEYRAF